MTAYLRWSLRQLYLLLFWPTQFERENEELRMAERSRYILRMLPWIIALPVLGNLIGGHACEAFGLDFDWERAWGGVVVGVGYGVVVGVGFGVGFGVGVGVASGVGYGVGYGVGATVAGGVVVGVGLGVGVGVGYGVELGVLEGVGLGVVGGVAGGVVEGVLKGVLEGVGLGVAGGLALSLTYFQLLAYPFDLTSSTVLYFLSRLRPSAVPRAWRWCPVTWKENIWLPLPFVSKLLVLLTRQNREEGFRQIAFVAAERRLQGRVALAALAEVAVDDLGVQSVSEIADVTEKLNWTTDAPIELPAELRTALPRFDRTAGHVGQYLVLHSAYRKGEALRRALAEVLALQRSLIAARGKAAPRLLSVANGWRDLLETERKTFRADAEAKREILNPFVFGNAIEETEHNVFTGRGDIVRRIEESLLGGTQTPTLLLHGPRRVGKTSILKQLPRLLGPDFAPTVMDCQNRAITGREATLGTLLRYLSRALSDGLRRKRVSVDALSREALTQEPFAVFDEWLDEVEGAMPDGMRSLLCLDEYEGLQTTLNTEWGAELFDFLRYTLQHRSRLVLMFTGAHTFAELGPAWTDRFISARRIRVSFLTHDEVIPLLTKPIPEFDMTYAAGAFDAIFDATNGQPFLTQAVAFELVQILNEGQRREATPDDVEEAIARALTSGGEYFANVWSDARADGQAILLALIRGDVPPDSPRARTWLREHDVLNDAGQFAVPMMKRWVKEKSDA